MKKKPVRQSYSEFSGKEVSRTRKILVFLFIVIFWVIYYWYQAQELRPLSENSSQEEPAKTEKQLSPLNSLLEKNPK